MWRRISLGLALAIALHVAGGAALVGWAFFHAAPTHIDIDIVGMRVEELKDLPLGAPAAGDKPASASAAPAPVDKSAALAARDDKRPPRRGTQGPDPTEAPAKPTDLQELGPEGARFTMLLRVDRLRGTPFAGPVDALLMHMPDRRDLLEGTGLDLYDDFDALLISTPDLMDYTATFLAARHHLGDAAMRAAIDRGARATGRVVAWRTEARRPWGERQLRAGATAAPGLAPRDARLLVLPAPGLIVVTPPAYRALLLARGAPPTRGSPDAGAADAGADGGAPAPSWTALLRRIDAEDGLLPPDGVAMVTAVDLLQGKSQGLVLMGVLVELPPVMNAVLGDATAPYVEVTAELPDAAAAERLAATWGVVQKRLRTNPFVVLGGLSPIIARVTCATEGSTVRLRVTTTPEETVRILQLVASALGG